MPVFTEHNRGINDEAEGANHWAKGGSQPSPAPARNSGGYEDGDLGLAQNDDRYEDGELGPARSDDGYEDGDPGPARNDDGYVVALKTTVTRMATGTCPKPAAVTKMATRNNDSYEDGDPEQPEICDCHPFYVQDVGLPLGVGGG